jgi:pimeloyl-ACP methyl ester carboxylesterase
MHPIYRSDRPTPAAPRTASAFFGVMLLAACGRGEPPAAAPVTDSPSSAKAALPRAANDGTPRILAEDPNGVHIQYRLYGSGEALVVLIHGWSCDSNYWAAQVPALRAKYAVATVDLAGHGGSGANRQDWSMRAFGEDVARVVKALPEYREVVLVGHSMGGPVAVEAARLLKGRVVGIIGVDTLRGIGEPRPSTAQRAAQIAAFEKDFVGTTRAFVTSTFFTPASDPVLVRRIADDMALAPPAVALGALRGLADWEGSAGIADAAVPLTLINAAKPPTNGDPLARLAPRFRLVTVDGLGHFLMMEDPARVNPILLAEIDALLAPAP